MDSCRQSHRSEQNSHRNQHQVQRQPTNNQIRDQNKPQKQPSVIQQDTMRITNKDLAFIFDPRRDQIRPYHLDGNSSMNTEAALQRRQSLKSDPTVVDSIHDFIQLYQVESNQTILKKEYERMLTRIAYILRPQINDNELRQIIQTDWERDTKGSDYLSRDMLFDSLFELCDCWCHNIDPDEYKEFFDQLKFRLRYEGQQDKAAYDILR